MPRGRPALLPEEKIASGTLRKSRAKKVTEVTPASGSNVVKLGSTSARSVAPAPLGQNFPQPPDWLTVSGRRVWEDNIARVMSIHFVTELDTDFFANFCNLQGSVVRTWKCRRIPASKTLTEVRRMMEVLGLAGRRSRLVKVDDGSSKGNSFSKNGRPPTTSS